MTAYAIEWSHGAAEVLSTAAVLSDCRFDLPRGPFRPFARAPWMGEVHDLSIIGHLRELGGDFACVPFGAPAAPVGPEEWARLMTDPPAPPIHGPAGDSEWQEVSRGTSSVTLSLDYPEGLLVERLERTVSVRDGAAVLDSELTIHPRRSGSISVGLHPILRLPERKGGLRLEADFAFGLVHPRQVEEGGVQEFEQLHAVPVDGKMIDLSRVPVGLPNVSVQLCGMRGPLRAEFEEEGAGIELDWDRSLLPSLQIWCTDRGIDGPPWHGRYRGLGIEPIASAFDLGAELSTRPNPINQRGVPTSVNVSAGVPLTIRHSVRAYSMGESAH